jgi:hypothetical protein
MNGDLHVVGNVPCGKIDKKRKVEPIRDSLTGRPAVPE